MRRMVLPALAGLFLSVANASAESPDPKVAAVNLDELKYAVAVAHKRGDNVEAVAVALSAFENALPKATIKPGEVPPKLTALRAAVEVAFKKGENVEAISKELGHIEKALTGKAFERVKAPDPVVEPEPAFPFRPGRPRRGFGRADGFGGGRIVIGGGNFNSTAVTISNNRFTIRARRDNVNYTITSPAQAKDTLRIVIRDGEKMVEATEVKKVPEKYRPAVEELLKMVKR